MDTGTHLVIGLGLAGLAYVDPVVASDATVATAVLIGTVLGSQAPDSDGLLRFRGNAAYIKNHRGVSHSIPALFIWTALITLALAAVFGGSLPLLHVGGWVFAAVAFHVFTDLFNTYGTQAIRPFSKKWVSWNIIHIFDPFIFGSHLFAIFLWSVHLAKPSIVFPVLYSFIAIYYIWRTAYHFWLERNMRGKDDYYEHGDKYYLIPTVSLYVWNVVKKHADGSFTLGEYRNKTVKWVDSASCASHPAVDASKQHPDIAAFLYFSSFACAELREHNWGYEVRWADVRYRHRKQYPFVAVLLLDNELRPFDSYVGWLSDSRLEKRLNMDSY
ncbi:MAG: metal-dependent hydrolase [Paenibacillaceae bacterium]|uniref:metal-dependent hydrolase n=1 Tax=Paenibacillus cymbidii TaxID=1639034 RepID=UPI0010812DBD|nr:metal-dependent hydrolase [Paenibacillus cymbidii]MBO9605402.1 metal-dependent hydrolase [Paenibacillaceae bacterium]